MTDALFDRDGWWDPGCSAFRSLQRVSEFRLALLRGWLPRGSLTGAIVDLGCGGGLLAVPLAQRGARVVGVDAAFRALRAAHARGESALLLVRGDLAQCPLAAGSADVVLLADVLEHLPDPSAAVAEAARVLRPGGHLFVNTINRTWRSRVLAITLGEGLGFVPRGTHRHRDFVRPEELAGMARVHGLEEVASTGESPRLWRTIRDRAVHLKSSRSKAVGYAVLFRKRQ